MGEITDPGPVKLFIGMLSQDVSLIEELKNTLSDIFGTVDLESPVWIWEHTRYYESVRAVLPMDISSRIEK